MPGAAGVDVVSHVPTGPPEASPDAPPARATDPPRDFCSIPEIDSNARVNFSMASGAFGAATLPPPDIDLPRSAPLVATS